VVGIPIYVSGEVGGGIRLAMNYTLVPTGSGLDGSIGASAFGSVGGGVGFRWLSAGVYATFTLLENTLHAGLNASFRGVRGFAKFDRNSSQVRIAARIQIGSRWFKRRFERVLHETSSPGESRYLLKV
jgi:hypothetical protein